MKNVKSILTDLLYYTAGCFIFSLAVTMITVPNNISPGGLTGIAAIINTLTGLPTGFSVFVINIPILIVAYKRLGGAFILKTGAATAIVSIMLELTEVYLPQLMLDGVLASIFGGIMMGVGLALVFLRGATTGGVDIIAKLINLKSQHLTIGKLVLIMDGVVVLLSIIVYKSLQSGLYTVISIFISSKMIDYVLYGADKGNLIYVITKNKKLGHLLTQKLERGVTVVSAIGAYTNSENLVLLCAVRVWEVTKFRQIVKKEDPNAFMMVSSVTEIIGEGFKKLD